MLTKVWPTPNSWLSGKFGSRGHLLVLSACSSMTASFDLQPTMWSVNDGWSGRFLEVSGQSLTGFPTYVQIFLDLMGLPETIRLLI